MPCLLVILALAVPRLTIVLLYFFTTWFRGVFDSLLLPILGFIFAPVTLLWYTAVHDWWGGVWGTWQIVGLVVAMAILAHELPREIGNAGVLVAGGYAPRRAFLLSIATTAAIPLGALGIALVGHSPLFLGTSLALAAGTTIYLACGDVLPGLWPGIGRGHRFTPALGVAAGMAFMWLAAALDHGH